MRVSFASVLLLRTLERRQFSDAEEVCGAICEASGGPVETPECATSTAAGFTAGCLTAVCPILVDPDMQACVSCLEAYSVTFTALRAECAVASSSAVSLSSLSSSSSLSASSTSSEDEVSSTTSSATSTRTLTATSTSTDDLETGTASPRASTSSSASTTSRTLEEHEMKSIPRYSPTTLVRPSDYYRSAAAPGETAHDGSAASRSIPGSALLGAAVALAALI
ncbi:hypothetical protein A1Q2_00397 [Trichosporon asahii var. asahii CBS 8904]|uniref:Uncharacterized protein n=1 Tax=Trichosporon asahii var. asahii (strain CBS 8904) TaxID=1220162 RepID=K1WX86_TRIAC|nr:hypothetical protein A1Q2_00397 [Trichosporon asahii var. asahii CBS 8904]